MNPDFTWYRVSMASPDARSLQGDDVTTSMIDVAMAALREIGCGGLTIREPELWTHSARWTRERCFDGRYVALDEASALLRAMLLSEGFWCRLESDSAALHVGDDVLYVGAGRRLSSVSDTRYAGVLIDAVPRSPYQIVRPAIHPYEVADPAYWARLERRLDGHGSRVVFLRQWAAGFGGEQWYLLTHGIDVAAVADDSVPRSIYATFPDTAIFERATTESDQLRAALGEEVVVGNVRILSRVGGEVRLSGQVVSDELSLSAVWALASPDSLLVEWPADDSMMEFAVDADPDGVVRTAAVFD